MYFDVYNREMKEGFHFTASVYIVHQNKVVLCNHKKIDLVLPVGGYVETGETPEQTVIREAKEEAGLDIQVFNKEDWVIQTETWRNINHGEGLAYIEAKPGVVQLDFAFYATTDSLAGLGTGEYSKDDLLVVSREELEMSSFDPDVKHYGLLALEILGE